MTENEITFLLAIIVLTLSAVTDIKEYRIPNIFTFPAMIAGMMISLAYNDGRFVEKLIWLIVLFLLGTFGATGMGDLKLIMALTALRGINEAAIAVLFAAIILYGYCLMTETKTAWLTLKDTAGFLFLRKPLRKRSDSKFPFALYLMAGYGAVMAFNFLS